MTLIHSAGELNHLPALFTCHLSDAANRKPACDVPSAYLPSTRRLRGALSGKVAHIPSREEMQPIVNEQLIVELYSR
jgi:ribosomal protein S4